MFITFFFCFITTSLMIKRVDVFLLIFVLIVSFMEAKRSPFMFLIWEY